MAATVSVIIPTFNRADSVPGAISSALNQTAPPAEVIVVDDGSTDSTHDQLMGFGGSIKTVAIPHSGLPSVARNAGIRAAKGELIAFLDADDEWLPDKLELQQAVLEKNGEIGLVCGNCRVRSTKWSGVDGGLYFEGKIRERPTFRDLLRRNVVVNSTALVARTAMDLAGLLDEDPLLRGVEDYDLWLRIAQYAELRFIPTPLAIYSDRADSIRSAQTRSQYWLSLLRILDKGMRSNAAAFIDHQKLVRWRRSECLNALAAAYAREGKGAKMLSISVKRIRNSPAAAGSYLSVLLNAMRLIRSQVGGSRLS